MKVILTYNELRRDGMGTAAITLYKALKAHGVEARPIHAWREVNFPEYEAEAKPLFVRNGPRHDPITDGCEVRGLVEALNGLGDDGDVIIDSGSPNWMCTIPYLKPGLRWITCVHSINPSTLKICRAYPERVSAFVCISKGVYDRFLSKLPAKWHGKVHLIPNAVAEAKDPKTDWSNDGILRILFLGRIEANSKGCDKIPKILRELKRRGVAAKADLYGYFHNWEREWWKAVDSAGVRDMVEYRGEAAHEDVYRVMREYDVFLAPSNFEGFSLSVSEAMSCALPVVSSLIPGVTDWMLDYGRCGMAVKKTDIDAFADALCALAESKDLRRKIGLAARERITDLAGFDAHGRMYAGLAVKASTENGYGMIKPECPLERFEMPACLKPWGPARLLPAGIKNMLRRFM